ncbi:hybrid-cluster NAD(P)-dependent oxidoreductase [Maribius pontilimi]|uniref:Hybrid-cluster NAD(P)-dependent oxidoreductase n=1 Tax=Palleronia pontilimi TaxID=1964209 RepID=A0A934IAS6_9RHOB|nr:hybrid-cluster NAD(P)-dependent oxidoreductase [Palleronia pontilimi]MBJ3763643.1 hybrid-cluster NAD(P)-dependent oxidoreductase [Palleronia pontilimi]
MRPDTPPALAFWTDSEALTCVNVLPETANTATFTFRPQSGALFHFKPGQFVTLELPVPGGPLHRTYTISSAPSRPTSLTVTVKAQPDSIGGRWMLDHLRPGMAIKATGPGGDFSHHVHPAAKYLFISAGSGITPMMSMTTQMYDAGADPDIVFLNCARRPSEIIFRERLEHIASRSTGIALTWVVEQADPYAPWTGIKGQFNQLILGLVAPDYLEREVFCCGPEPFMRAVREALAGLGYDMDRYHQESFHAPIADVTDAPEDVVPDAAEAVEVSFARSGKTARMRQTETLLAAAKTSGVRLPTGCTFGVCGTCKTRKIAGDVHMVHNGGITEDEIAEGYVLACCSHPIGDVTLDI